MESELPTIPPERMEALVNKNQKQPVSDKDLEREAALGREKDLDYEHFEAQEKEKAGKGVLGCFWNHFK